MKKRLLITSIVMMLVVAVALSTATYAWFTSNANVTASTITLTAQTNDAAALGIGWGLSTADGASAGTEIVATSSGTLYPMAPVTLEDGVTPSDVLFKTSTIKTVSNTLIFNANGENTTPVTYGNGTASTFFVKNVSPSSPIAQVTVTATITDSNTEDAIAADELVRIAIFKKDGENGFKLVGVMAKTDDAATIYGTIVANSAAVPSTAALGEINGTTYTASQMHDYEATAAATGLTLGGLAAGVSHDLIAIAWLDGAALNDTTQGVAATISLTFSA